MPPAHPSGHAMTARPDTPPARSPDAPSGGVVGIPGDRCRVRLRVMGLPGAVRATVDAVEADTEPATTPPHQRPPRAPTLAPTHPNAAPETRSDGAPTPRLDAADHAVPRRKVGRRATDFPGSCSRPAGRTCGLPVTARVRPRPAESRTFADVPDSDLIRDVPRDWDTSRGAAVNHDDGGRAGVEHGRGHETPEYLLDRHAPTGVLKSVTALRIWASTGYSETAIVVTHGDAPETAEERSRPPDVRDGRNNRRVHARARATAARPGEPRPVDRRAAPRRAEGPPPSETARGVAGPVATHVSGLQPAGNRASRRRVLRLELSGPGAPAGPQAGVATRRASPPTSGTTARQSTVRNPKIGKAVPISCPEANRGRAEATVVAHGGAQLQSTVIDRRADARPGFRAHARRQAPQPPGIEGRR